MEKKLIESLRQQYPSAPYTYFRINNYKQAREDFFEGKVKQPVFTYSHKLNQEILAARHTSLNQVDDLKSSVINHFIDRRKIETKLLICFFKLREDPKDSETLELYRQLMVVLYGAFDPLLFGGILDRLKSYAKSKGKEIYYDEIEALIRDRPLQVELPCPSEETFQYYHDLLKNSDHAIKKLEQLDLGDDFKDPEKIKSLFTWALNEIDAIKEGWIAVLSNGGSNVLISRHNKKIMIGKDYAPYTQKRAKQVVAHEVFVHVRRAILHNDMISPADEEGVGILIEQLINKKFQYKRLMRYLSAALAWGYDGHPRTFSETYEVLFKAFMIIINPNNEKLARERAFAETARIFRGGLPAVAGAAYIKDKVYFETNLEIWDKLDDKKLTSKQFINMIDGYKG